MTKIPSHIHLSGVETFLLDLLPRAGHILRRYFHSENLSKKKKGELDFVTEADLAVDAFIKKELEKFSSDIPILSEETAPEDFSSCAEKELLWVVDPLDGTSNFSRGSENFSISIALVSYGLPLIGAIFAPISSRLFWARSDEESAFWNGRRIHVAKISSLEEAVVCSDWSHHLDTRHQTTEFFNKIFQSVRQIKILGSAATDITLLARGAVDIYSHVCLSPWDVAAAALIAQKAGAYITDMEGKQWNVFTPGILMANPLLHKKMLWLLQT